MLHKIFVRRKMKLTYIKQLSTVPDISTRLGKGTV